MQEDNINIVLKNKDKYKTIITIILLARLSLREIV